MAIVEQVGKDCIVTLNAIPKTIKNCNAIALANTLWDKSGAKYTEERMEKWGFILKEIILKKK